MVITPNLNRGDIVLVNLDPVIGSEQGRIRPCIIIQNNISNFYSPTIILAPLTSKQFNKEFPTNVSVPAADTGLGKDSTILLNQIRTVDKLRIINRFQN